MARAEPERSLRCVDVDSLDGIPADVEALSLRGGSLRSLRGVERLRGLKSLALRAMPELVDLCALAELEAVEKLTVAACPGVVELVLPPAAVEVRASGLPGLATVRGPSQVAGLHLRRCGLRRAPALPDCPALEILDLSGCAELAELDALAAHPRLNALVLEGCTALADVECLREAPNLRAIALHASGVEPRSPSKWLAWRCTWDTDRRALNMRTRPAPFLADEALDSRRRKALARLRKLAADPTGDTARQVVELVRALGDPGLGALLFEGLRWGSWPDGTFWRPGHRLSHPKIGTERLLLAGARIEHPGLQAFYARIDRLELSGTGELGALAALPGLETLSAAALAGRGRLGRLRALSLRQLGPTGLAGAELPELRELAIDAGEPLDCRELGAFPGLQRLAAPAAVHPEALRALPGLEAVSIRGVEGYPAWERPRR